MTLVVAVCNGDETVVVSDRLITTGGTPEDDDAGKQFVVQWSGGRLVVGFAGLARLRGPRVGSAVSFDTRQWLLDEIKQILKPEIDIDDLTARIAEAATRRFRQFGRVSPVDRQLSIVCAGYKYSSGNAIRGAVLISNFESLDGSARAVGEFTVELLPIPPAEDAYVLVIGNATDSLDSRMRQIVGMAGRHVGGGVIAQRIFDVIRNYSREKASGGVVGGDCISVTMPFDSALPVQGLYHSATYPNRIHICETIVADPPVSEDSFVLPAVQFDLRLDGAVEGESIFSHARSDGRCTCGSGRLYRRCHGDSRDLQRVLRALQRRDLGNEPGSH